MTVIINGTTGIDAVQDAKISPAKLTTNGSGGFTLPTSAGNAVVADSSGRVTIPNQPVFFAQRNGGHYSGSAVIVYDGVNLNVGSHYNGSNGRFTAPVSGVYQFSVTQINNGGTGITESDIRKNGTTFANIRGYGNGATNAGASGTFLVSLVAGDYVDVYNASTSTVYGVGYYTTFSGCLIG